MASGAPHRWEHWVTLSWLPQAAVGPVTAAGGSHHPAEPHAHDMGVTGDRYKVLKISESQNPTDAVKSGCKKINSYIRTHL